MEKNKNSQNLSKTNKNNTKNIKIKNNSKVPTREQCNYYNPKLHKKNWAPSGKFQEQSQKYTYGDSGLGYNLKDTNIIQNEKSSLDKSQTHFLEFDFMENNDVIITIEHSSNCEEHLNHTNHLNDIYKKISKLLQLCINIRFPFIKVFLKPIDTSSNKHLNRLGALEVQLAIKMNDKQTITTLFSKLNSNQWPNFNNILNKINNIMPVLNIKCTIYDKEEDLDNTSLENNENDNNNINLNKTDKNINKNNLLVLPSKYENIKINLYSLKNSQLDTYSQEAANQLDITFNPKRKTEMYKEEQISKTNKSKMNVSNINKLSLAQKSISTRPQSGIKNKSLNNTFNYSVKNNSSFSFFNQSKRSDVIEDVSILNQLKGKILSSGYSDKSGNLFFENVPYDSYLIEVENNKNFLSCGMVVQFQKIIDINNINKKNIANNGNYIVNKLIGLKRQIDAYVEVYLFSKGKNENNDFSGVNLISDARVILVKKFFESGDIVSGNMDEFELEENKKIKGRYEIITVPGEAELNVFKQGYENVYKHINLKNGINKINIELVG